MFKLVLTIVQEEAKKKAEEEARQAAEMVRFHIFLDVLADCDARRQKRKRLAMLKAKQRCAWQKRRIAQERRQAAEEEERQRREKLER
eukprot:767137-Hanusia_phi.AAC.2